MWFATTLWATVTVMAAALTLHEVCLVRQGTTHLGQVIGPPKFKATTIKPYHYMLRQMYEWFLTSIHERLHAERCEEQVKKILSWHIFFFARSEILFNTSFYSLKRIVDFKNVIQSMILDDDNSVAYYIYHIYYINFIFSKISVIQMGPICPLLYVWC